MLELSSRAFAQDHRNTSETSKCDTELHEIAQKCTILHKFEQNCVKIHEIVPVSEVVHNVT